MLKVYLVEDEPLARDELKYILHRSKQVDILGESDNVEDAMRDIAELNPDLVFLDIELGEKNGLQLAEQLLKMDPAPAIVFATAYDEFALQAFDLYAIDYILKPFDDERIYKSLKKIKEIQKIGMQEVTLARPIKSESNAKIAISVDKRIIVLPHHEIIFLEAVEGNSIVTTEKKTYTVTEALIVLEKKLANTQFVRVHRSFIINIDHIVEIHPWFNSTYNLLMKDGSKVPVSRTYVRKLKQVVGF